MRVSYSVFVAVISLSILSSISWADVGGVNTMTTSTGVMNSGYYSTSTTMMMNTNGATTTTTTTSGYPCAQSGQSYIVLPSSTTATFTSPSTVPINSPSATVQMNPVCLGVSCPPTQ